MTDLSAFESALRSQLDADRLAVVPPPVEAVRGRARSRQRARAAGAVLATAALVGGAVLGVDPGTQPGGGQLATGADEVVLASGTDGEGPWRLLGRVGERCVVLVQAMSERGACSLTDPPRLDETSVLSVGRGASAVTLVAGLVPDGAEEVVVVTDDAREAEVRRAAGLAFFVLQVDGVTGVETIVAADADGQEVARLAVPLPPPAVPQDAAPPSAGPSPEEAVDAPPPPLEEPVEIKAPPATRLEATDEFGRVVAVRDVADGVEVDVDRVEMLSGREAQEAAAERGDMLETDYYVVNDVERVRTYRLAPGAVVWGSIGLSGQPDAERSTVQQWRAFVRTARGADALFHLDVEGAAVVGIEEQYLP